MAAARGFADLNPYEGAAGVVLPESQTIDGAIDQIKQNGILVNKQRAVNQQYQAQVNKDFSTNKLNISPIIQYNSELSGLAQKWYDKGVQYRRQNFDPFNPNYNNKSQVDASEQYLAEKKRIEDLADLAKGVDKDYASNKKLNEEGKLENFDEYNDGLKNMSLQELHSKGGLSALPTLSPKYDTQKVDSDIKIHPTHAYSTVETSPGVFEKKDEEYVDMKKASRIAENAMANHPGFLPHLKKMGIDPNKLYTKGGHFMTYDPSDPSDFGTIDQPAMMRAMSVDMLTTPDGIKNLPASVKQKIVADAGWDKNPFNASSLGLQAGGVSEPKKPYDPTEDPDFQQHLMTEFNKQLPKEAKYVSMVADRVGNNIPELKNTTKTDTTKANLKLRQQGLGISQAHLSLAQQANDRANAKWNEHLSTANSREAWIKDIQNLNEGAITDLKSAVKEVHGRVIQQKGVPSVFVEIPETVPNTTTKMVGVQYDKGGVAIPGTGHQEEIVDATNPKKQIMHRYRIDKTGGSASRIQLEQVLNKLPTFGKEKGLKTEPYSQSYDDVGSENGTADDL